jgi:hypothetical protein
MTHLTTFRTLPILLLVLLLQSFLFAGAEVYPTSLFINAPNKTASISVSNPTETRQEVWIDYKFGYPVAGDSGKFSMRYVDAPYTGELSAVAWLKAYPQRFVLNPKESQLVRIMVSAPMNVAPAEYWARIVVSSTTREVKKVVTPGGASAGRFQYVSQVDIPLHYRFGSVSSVLTVRDVATKLDTGVLRLSIDVARAGNASYWGSLSLTLKDNSGKIFASQNDVVAIYKDIIYPASLDVRAVPAGSYNLELVFSPKRRGVPAQFALKSDAVKFSKVVVLP